MDVEAIFFDLDDTLVVEQAAAEAAFIASCSLASERYGLDAGALHRSVRRRARELWVAAPTIDYCRAVGISSWEGLWAGFHGSDPNLKSLREWAPVYRREAWSRALADHGVRDSSFAVTLADTFLKERRLRHILFPEVKNVLDELRRDYRMALITNGVPDLQREKIRGAGLSGYFETIIISGDIGVGKPDPRIFGFALEEMHADPGASAMVGNSLARDVNAAQELGLRGIWINRRRRERGEHRPPDAEIAGLDELRVVFEKTHGGRRAP